MRVEFGMLPYVTTAVAVCHGASRAKVPEYDSRPGQR